MGSAAWIRAATKMPLPLCPPGAQSCCILAAA
jgi:hypothetical protein